MATQTSSGTQGREKRPSRWKWRMPVQIAEAILEVEQRAAEGESIEAIAADLGISASSYHRWRSLYHGLNADDILRTPSASVVPANPVPSALGDDANTYYKGDQNFSGYNFVAFGQVAPSTERLGSTGCGRSPNVVQVGTPAGGLAFSGFFPCATADPFEGLIRAVVGGGMITTYPGGATGPDGTPLSPPGKIHTLGTGFSVNGETRWTLEEIPNADVTEPRSFIDTKAPTGGALVLTDADRFIDNAYNFRSGYTPPVDGGVGLAADASWFYLDSGSTSFPMPTGTGADVPVSATNTEYSAIAKHSDRLGNTAPDIVLVGRFGKLSSLRASPPPARLGANAIRAGTGGPRVIPATRTSPPQSSQASLSREARRELGSAAHETPAAPPKR